MDRQQERRSFSRFNLLVDVSVSKRASSQKEKLLMTKNISQGGACIIAYEELKLGDLLDLKIHLPDSKEEIKVIGKVAWCKEFSIGNEQKGKRFDVGVEFVGLNDNTFEKINKYLFSRK
jgi:Tfp pilus assembly protein PilZ